MLLRVPQSAFPGLAITFAFDEEIFVVVAEGWHEILHLLLDGFCRSRPAGQYESDRVPEHRVCAPVAHLSRGEDRLGLSHNLGESSIRSRSRPVRNAGPRLAEVGFQWNKRGNRVRIDLTAKTGE